MNFLNDIEKDAVAQFLDNKTAKEAVRKVILRRIYFDGVLQEGEVPNAYENFALNIYKDQSTGEMYTDEELGQLTKIRRFAIELLERGFKDMESLERVKESEPSKNPAR
jgi:hypothetical protein